MCFRQFSFSAQWSDYPILLCFFRGTRLFGIEQADLYTVSLSGVVPFPPLPPFHPCAWSGLCDTRRGSPPPLLCRDQISPLLSLVETALTPRSARVVAQIFPVGQLNSPPPAGPPPFPPLPSRWCGVPLFSTQEPSFAWPRLRARPLCFPREG